ncbi:hypothetical protein I3271_07460 [Photobacterium leiognathi]|uniref:hypothetical protein n=1 Tax=Photobacterium leiognathi TaxID=553611 RepID=UPI001EE0F659|nr:hypothetical protein [Photobacterium leiognathi]MCG3884523.1 hypothetical protein [Photobacterium leiognathi]
MDIKKKVAGITSRGVLELGDIVEPVDRTYPLVSGCARYDNAVVVSKDPFVLVSQCTTMRWGATVSPSGFVKVGKASKELLKSCKKRL